MQLLLNEVSLLATTSHPNIVKLEGFVEDLTKGIAWLIIPWQQNGNIREFLSSGDWEIPERIALASAVTLPI